MVLSKDAMKLLKEKKYFRDGEKSWDDLCKRVAKGIAKAEEAEERRLEVEKQIFESMSNLEFIFSTPVLLNADESGDGQLSSCFCLDTKDNIEAICQTDADFAKIFQRNGGAGTNLSVIRPAKSNVNSSKGYAGGVVAFMEKYDATADVMTRHNPSRKGAAKIDLSIFHPQIYDFIHCKDDTSKLNRMNISVALDDDFLWAVEKNQNWDLVFPDYENCKEIYDKEWDGNINKWKRNGYPVKVYKTVSARELLKEIAECAWKTGEPGINYSERMERDNKNKHIDERVYTNP